MKSDSYDFAVIGSGFGGSILSMILRRLGKSVLLIERGAHPRFAIGESSTPFANLLLERIAEKYNLPFLRYFSEWGLWQENFPEIAVGLKRGFTFYYHTPGKTADWMDRSRQLLVAASPNDQVADTHWYRPDFDYFLVRKAVDLGVEYVDRASISELRQSRDGWTFSLEAAHRTIRTTSVGFIIDASGQSGLLAQNLSLDTELFESMPQTAGVYAHLRGVARLDEITAEARDSELPYPPDDAAMHHVFPSGWIWVLRFNNGITSAGAAYTRAVDVQLARNPELVWKALLAEYPSIEMQFRGAAAVTPFYSSPQLSFRRSAVAGEAWALLPSSAGFVDPLLSSGFALTLLGILRLGEVFEGRGALEDYQSATLCELDATADLISALYATMDRFEDFSLLTLLYFAAMSFTETAWRLGKEELASKFLLTNDCAFSSTRKKLCGKARLGDCITKAEITRAIAAYDIAGLTDWRRKNRYPVEMRDLLNNADKVQASPSEMENLFARMKIPSLPLKRHCWKERSR